MLDGSDGFIATLKQYLRSGTFADIAVFALIENQNEAF